LATPAHRPQDSLATPIDARAAADFNRFFYTLAEVVSDAPERPSWQAGATLRPTSAEQAVRRVTRTSSIRVTAARGTSLADNG
jgi:hypothetical protein